MKFSSSKFQKDISIKSENRDFAKTRKWAIVDPLKGFEVTDFFIRIKNEKKLYCIRSNFLFIIESKFLSEKKKEKNPSDIEFKNRIFPLRHQSRYFHR